MADFSKFRTSLGGFNRNDVSDYMTKLCAEHQAFVKQSEKERAALEQKLEAAEQALAAREAEAKALREELDAAEALLTGQSEEEPAPDYVTMELEAYRRAEATERMAAERSAKMRQQLSDLLDTVAVRYEEAGQEIQALGQDIRSNLNRLEESLADLEQLFGDTTGSLQELDENEPIPC